MAGGKKRASAKKAAAAATEATIPPEVEEEFVAVEAIMGEGFGLHEDSLGFSLQIVPEMGGTPEDNYVSVELIFR
jgi:hypothetical protein